MLPSRSSAPDSSSRVVALLGQRQSPSPRPGGWTPEQQAFPPPAEAPDVEPERSWERPPPEAPVVRSQPVAPTDEVATPGTVVALLRSGRIDPGRRGALALAAVGVVAAVIAAVVLLRGRPSEQPLPRPAVVGASTATAGPELVIDVAGKVRRPGLVRLRTGARIDDALKAAGGVLAGVSTGGLNLARKVADGEQVLVGLDPPAPGPGPSGATTGGLLDLNTATLQDLDALPGIGPVLADRIVSWRTEHGRFASADQLREVSGIGESKYQSLKSKVRV